MIIIGIITNSYMQIPFINLKKEYLVIKNSLDAAWHSVNNKAEYVLGRNLECFEREFANSHGFKFAIGVANGLDALTLTLKALKVSKNDEVIVPAHTFIATWFAVNVVGAIPVPIDIEEDTFNINVSNIESKISKKTKAIIPVNLYGRLVDIDNIMELAERVNLPVVVDAAQSHGIKVKQNVNCHWAFSFYPTKNLGCLGDGGGITTNDAKLLRDIRVIRNYGSIDKYVHKVLGVNSRLDELQAAVLRIKLKKLDNWNKKRRKLVNYYLELLNGVGDLLLPKTPRDANLHVWHLFVIRTKKRDQLKDYLSSQGIGTLIHYPIPPFAQQAYSNLGYTKNDFPITTRVSAEILSLPLGPHMRESELNYVVSHIKKFFSKYYV